ncbi:uncharacterized protein LOC130775561 [Actinidia eriantha]|uniref:uncharacterized protein LOC130775561 n=1 Tax=Actinidia eriantha TaxID=165200 RepID=UPI0025853CF0|nr:uncharacterized protein LOC130775561 [Actinidia eriantha]
MKKLFFFRSSASSSGNNNPDPPSSDSGVNDKAADKGTSSFRSPRGLSKSRKQVFEKQTSDNDPCLRRSQSFSLGLDERGIRERNLSCFSNPNGSPCSSSNVPHKRSDRHSSRCRTLTPERQSRPKYSETAVTQNAHAVEKPGFYSSRGYYDSSESSSYCSSNVSNNVVDRYIDGEQEQENRAPKSDPSQRNQFVNGNVAGKRPPRVQYTAPASPTDSMKEKTRSHSFRETKGAQLRFSSRDWVESGFGHESPRSLAKHVIERLSQTRVFPNTCLKEFDPDIPITIEDIYGGSLNRCPSSNADGGSQRSCPLDGPEETTEGYHHKEISDFQKRNCFRNDNRGVVNSVEAEEDIDVELLRKSKEAEERVMLLSAELEQDDFLQDRDFSVPALIQTIRNLTEERVDMAHEVSAVLHAQIAERASAREELRLAGAELDSRTRRLEKEKTQLQSALEKELDRRSSDWSFKLEKYQEEEHRLRERVRELAEQNVSLQRDVSSLSEREMESRSRLTGSELQLKELTTRVEEMNEENQNLRQNFAELQEKCRAAEEDRDCIKRNYEAKEKEGKDMHRSISRILRTCSEQEKTIDGLRKGLSEEVWKKGSQENIDKQLGKLQMEQIRLTGVEQTLRKEVESYRIEVDSLRHENINLLHRLKVSGKEGGFSTFKLDQELINCVSCMRSQGLSLLNESNQLCTKVLEYIKVKAGQTLDTKQGIEFIQNGLDGQFVVESDMKVQGFKRGTESLTRSLQTISGVLNEKSNSHCSGDGSGQLIDQSSEDILRSELKAETLLTSLLREKLYSKEVEVEQLQAELAAAVRGNGMLRCEVQNQLDNLSCMTHRMKDFELQMIKKDENVNRLQDDLQERTKELTIVRGILPKVSEERDLMWDEVKQYSERNMLLNSEINALRKKIEALDEDILLKEGQISILKDTVGKPFDLLASPDYM